MWVNDWAVTQVNRGSPKWVLARMLRQGPHVRVKGSRSKYEVDNTCCVSHSVLERVRNDRCQVQEWYKETGVVTHWPELWPLGDHAGYLKAGNKAEPPTSGMVTPTSSLNPTSNPSVPALGKCNHTCSVSLHWNVGAQRSYQWPFK